MSNPRLPALEPTRAVATVFVRQGDLCTEKVDCVVNPANSNLRHGAGCAGALSVAAGPKFQAWSTASVLDEGPVPVGTCRMGPGFGLPARRVAHVVGPRVVNRAVTVQDQTLLASCVREALLQADFEGLRSIAIPAVSSGLFGFPKNLCATVLVGTALALAPRLESVRTISFVNNDELTTNLFLRALEEATGR
jgi:O-acetyl-ADP-ribose deacetylase (regulator of RNase III)